MCIASLHSCDVSSKKGGQQHIMAGRMLTIVALVVLWYVASFFTDTFNKQIQASVRIPATLTMIQFLAGGICSALALRGFKLQKFVALRKDQVTRLLPISVCWTIGFLTTNYSLGQSAVSFTHAIKASEPLFLLVISTLFFKKSFAAGVWLSLVPVVIGIALVAVTDLSFSVLGFSMACLSNCCFVLRAIFAKSITEDKFLDDLNLFYYISWISFFGSIPFVLLELPVLTAALGSVSVALVGMITANGILHFVYNQCSMLVLSRVPALTHSILNASRRFFIIMAAVVYFGTVLTDANKLGIALLILGVGLYVYCSSKAAVVAKKTS